MTRCELDAALVAAHARGDPLASSRLNERAAELARGPADRRFLLTQAWVHALEAGRADADRLEALLAAAGGFDMVNET